MARSAEGEGDRVAPLPVPHADGCCVPKPGMAAVPAVSPTCRDEHAATGQDAGPQRRFHCADVETRYRTGTARRFVPVRDKSTEAQTIAVAASARLPLPRIGQVVADLISDEAQRYLAAVRDRGVAR
jgi:hypothetical protein